MKQVQTEVLVKIHNFTFKEPSRRISLSLESTLWRKITTPLSFIIDYEVRLPISWHFDPKNPKNLLENPLWLEGAKSNSVLDPEV